MEDIQNYAASFGSLKSGVVVELGFPVKPNETLYVNVSNKAGQVAELEFDAVKFEGFTDPNTDLVDLVYILKPRIPFVIEGKKR